MLEGAPQFEGVEREFTMRVDEGYFDALINFINRDGLRSFKEILRTEILDEDKIREVNAEYLEEDAEGESPVLAFTPEEKGITFQSLMNKIEGISESVLQGREALKTNPVFIEKYRSGELSFA